MIHDLSFSPRQATLAKPASCTGIGLHSGSDVRMTIYPAKAGEGIVFKRADIAGNEAFIPARYDLVCETQLGTTLRNAHGVSVATVEHLMAALAGLGVDNAVIELDAPEVPIMDGSSAPFVALLRQAGLVSLAAPRRVLHILKSVEYKEGLSFACVQPHDDDEEGMVIDIDVEYAHPAIKRQTAIYDFRKITFDSMLSEARTFGFERDVKALRAQGLALGGSLANAIVLGEDRVLNAEGLRFADEFVRHKALDCVGDLALAGLWINGSFTFTRPGHGVNNKLLRAIFANPAHYRIGTPGAAELPLRAQALAASPAYL